MKKKKNNISRFIYPSIDLLLKMKKKDTIGFGNEYYKGKKHWIIIRDK